MYTLFRSLIRFMAAMIIISSLLLAPPFPAAHAASIVVNTLEDELNSDGDCSLREAITAANTNLATDACPAGEDGTIDAITFVVNGTIILDDQLPIIIGDSSVIIDGGGDITISGNNNVRVLYVDIDSHLTLQNLIIANGTIQDYEAGGGLYNLGSVTVSNSNFFANTAAYGGAISNNGTLRIDDSSFAGNSATIFGGGILNAGPLEINNSSFNNNSANNSGGGIANYYDSIEIRDSTFRNNYSGWVGGGIYTECGWSTSEGCNINILNSVFNDNQAYHGGGVYNYIRGVLTLLNSTFSSNSATGSPGAGGGLMNMWGSIYIINSTLFGNWAMLAGGNIYNNENNPVTFKNTIVAYSTSGGNCSGVMIDEGYNIDSENTCSFSSANSSMSNTNPMLGPLQDNGGPTFTHGLLTGSPAIDAIPINDCTTASDQRGVSRPQGAACDIGAYEYELVEIPVQIDIMPKNPYNPIDLRSTARVSLAVLSTANFDAPMQIARETQTFGRTGYEQSLYRVPPTYKLACGVTDVNRDGLKDLVCDYEVQKLGFQCGDTLGLYRATLVDGTPIIGQDAVLIRPCP